MIKNFEGFKFFNKEKFGKGDFVRLKKIGDIGNIVTALGSDGYIVGFLEPRGVRGSVFNSNELEKITKEEYELARDAKKYNV